jgi:hypothetical protein
MTSACSTSVKGNPRMRRQAALASPAGPAPMMSVSVLVTGFEGIQRKYINMIVLKKPAHDPGRQLMFTGR